MTQLIINVNDLIVDSLFNIAHAAQTISELDLTGETMNVYVVTPVYFDDVSILLTSVIAGNKKDGDEYGWLKVASIMYTGQGTAILTNIIASGIKEFLTPDVINNWINNPPTIPKYGDDYYLSPIWHSMGATQPDGTVSVTVYDIDDNKKQFIDSYIQEQN